MKKNKEIYDGGFTIITGACGGLGRAFTLECAKAHENLILTGTNQKKLEDLISSMTEEFSDIEVKTFVMDLAKKSDRENFLMFLTKENLCVTKLINNAGVIIEGDMERFSDEEISNAIEVNCVGTLDITKKLLRVRDKSKKFKVLTVSSIASSYPIPHMAVYAATKSFLTSMMTALSVEHKNQNVTFTVVCPGGMETNPEMVESIKSMGLGGKLSCVSTEKVAKKSLEALEKNKKVVVIGGFNKLLVAISKPFKVSFLAKISGSIYKKSQEKRKF